MLILPVYLLFGASFAYAIVSCLITIIDYMRFKILGSEEAGGCSSITPTSLLKLVLVGMTCSFGGGLGIVYGLSSSSSEQDKFSFNTEDDS